VIRISSDPEWTGRGRFSRQEKMLNVGAKSPRYMLNQITWTLANFIFNMSVAFKNDLLLLTTK
jgi:hypothetical protein